MDYLFLLKHMEKKQHGMVQEELFKHALPRSIGETKTKSLTSCIKMKNHKCNQTTIGTRNTLYLANKSLNS